MAEKEKVIGNFFCAECGGQVIFTLERISPTFGIDDNGEIMCISNTAEIDGLLFHCENDMEHSVMPLSLAGSKFYKMYLEWRDAVEQKFYKEEKHWSFGL